MEEQIDIIRQASHALDAVLSVTLSMDSDAELCLFAVELEALGRKVDALRVQVAGEIGERSRIELGRKGLAYTLGCIKPEHLLEQITLISNAEAAQRVRVARATRPRCALGGAPLPAAYPIVATALVSGSIPVSSADVIIRDLTQAERTADPVWLRDAETSLVDAATRDSASLVSVQAKVWREALDPDGAERMARPRLRSTTPIIVYRGHRPEPETPLSRRGRPNRSRGTTVPEPVEGRSGCTVPEPVEG